MKVLVIVTYTHDTEIDIPEHIPRSGIANWIQKNEPEALMPHKESLDRDSTMIFDANDTDGEEITSW